MLFRESNVNKTKVERSVNFHAHGNLYRWQQSGARDEETCERVRRMNCRRVYVQSISLQSAT